MTFQDFINHIAPGVTLYFVLLTWGVLAFKFGGKFWDNEREIQTRYLEKIKAARENYREKYITPFLGKSVDDAVKEAYDIAFETIINMQKDRNTPLHGEELERAIDDHRKKLKEMVQSANSFFAHKSGQEFLDDMDKRYINFHRLAESYSNARYYNRTTYIFLFILGLGFLMGLLHLVFTPPGYLKYLYIYFILTFFLLSIYSMIRYREAEARLLRLFEEIALYQRY